MVMMTLWNMSNTSLMVIVSYPGGDDDTLKPVKDRLDGNRSIHTAEVHDRVRDGGCAVIKRLDD